MRILKHFLIIILLVISKITLAQKQASIWYFGRNAGIDFSSGSPVALLDGQINTDEGVASICNANGQLLFYTEGTTIWNAHHTIMPGGTGLKGSVSSSQSAIIVPKIGDSSRYYVFTVDQLGSTNGLCYSIINMSLDNGLGDVEVKNQPLLTPVCEKLTAVRHCNGRDIWVIVHQFNSDAFYAYLVSPSGVSASPVVSHTGTFISNTNLEYAIGCMKVSSDGKKLALANHHLGVDLDDFDNTSGVVSNGSSLFLPTESYTSERGPYGIEFSPNSKLLYISADYFNFSAISSYSIVLQYNVSLSGLASIQASKYVAYTQPAAWYAENFGSLQMAPDGKMYMAELGQPYLSVINNPDGIGAACDFVHAQFNLPYNDTISTFSTYGLPSFIQSYWKPGYTFSSECRDNLVHFDYEKTTDVVSVKWDFGDPDSGPDNYSSLQKTQHLYSKGGRYTVNLIRFTACGSDTVAQSVIPGGVSGSLGNDTLVCGLSQFILNAHPTPANVSYLWQDGSSNPSFTATKDGLYWVQLKNNENGCTLIDSINVTFRPLPAFDLGEDTNKCAGDVLVLSANIPSAGYLWSNGKTTDSLHVTQSGFYWLQVSLNGCVKRDSIHLIFNQYPVPALGKDTILCEGESLLLNAQNKGMEYEWQDNSKEQTYTVNTTGIYSVSVSNKGCVQKDTINISFLQKPYFVLGNDTSICTGMTIILNPKITAGTDLHYLWNTGSAKSSIEVSAPGIYSLKVENECGNSTDEIRIDNGVCQVYVPSAFSPNNDGLNDRFKALLGNNVTDFYLRVYNRWGELVFESKDIHNGWDGTYRGKPQQSGAFVWMIHYKSGSDHSEKNMQGIVNLLR